MEKRINMKSWHFKLYKKMMHPWLREDKPYHVNRCTYLKGVLKGIGCEIVKVLFYMLAVGVYSLIPLLIFKGFMTTPVAMIIFTLILLCILLYWAATSIKRKIQKYLLRFEPVRKIDDGFINLKDLIAGLFGIVKDHLCPIWVAVHPDYEEIKEVQ